MATLRNSGQKRSVLEVLHDFMFWWVTRAALLLLGIGVAFPQPNAHS